MLLAWGACFLLWLFFKLPFTNKMRIFILDSLRIFVVAFKNPFSSWDLDFCLVFFWRIRDCSRSVLDIFLILWQVFQDFWRQSLIWGATDKFVCFIIKSWSCRSAWREGVAVRSLVRLAFRIWMFLSLFFVSWEVGRDQFTLLIVSLSFNRGVRNYWKKSWEK